MATNDYEALANAIAETCPKYLDKPTMPILSWARSGDAIIVILADGRKAMASIEFAKGLLAKPRVNKIMTLPTHAPAKPILSDGKKAGK